MRVVEAVLSIDPCFYSVQVTFNFSLNKDRLFQLFKALPQFFLPGLLCLREIWMQELAFYFDGSVVADQSKLSIEKCLDWCQIGKEYVFFAIKLRSARDYFNVSEGKLILDVLR